MATDADTTNTTTDGSDTDRPSTTTTATSVKSAPLSKSGSGPRESGSSTGSTVAVLISAVLATLALIAAIVFGALFFLSGDDEATPAVSPEVRIEALDTARDYAIKLSSFDYRDLDMNREAIAAASTPGFAEKYEEMVTALTEIVQNGKGEATAEVSHAALENIDGERATVLLFVDQQAKNVVSPDGRVQPYRMVVTLERSDDRWLVDNVETK